MENSKNFSILSLDGGGIRGMLTATLLVTLENEIKAINPEYNLTNCFDFWLFGLCYAMDEDYKGWNVYEFRGQVRLELRSPGQPKQTVFLPLRHRIST